MAKTSSIPRYYQRSTQLIRNIPSSPSRSNGSAALLTGQADRKTDSEDDEYDDDEEEDHPVTSSSVTHPPKQAVLRSDNTEQHAPDTSLWIFDGRPLGTTHKTTLADNSLNFLGGVTAPWDMEGMRDQDEDFLGAETSTIPHVQKSSTKIPAKRPLSINGTALLPPNHKLIRDKPSKANESLSTIPPRVPSTGGGLKNNLAKLSRQNAPQHAAPLGPSELNILNNRTSNNHGENTQTLSQPQHEGQPTSTNSSEPQHQTDFPASAIKKHPYPGFAAPKSTKKARFASLDDEHHHKTSSAPPKFVDTDPVGKTALLIPPQVPLASKNAASSRALDRTFDDSNTASLAAAVFGQKELSPPHDLLSSPAPKSLPAPLSPDRPLAARLQPSRSVASSKAHVSRETSAALSSRASSVEPSGPSLKTDSRVYQDEVTSKLTKSHSHLASFNRVSRNNSMNAKSSQGAQGHSSGDPLVRASSVSKLDLLKPTRTIRNSNTNSKRDSLMESSGDNNSAPSTSSDHHLPAKHVPNISKTKKGITGAANLVQEASTSSRRNPTMVEPSQSLGSKLTSPSPLVQHPSSEEETSGAPQQTMHFKPTSTLTNRIHLTEKVSRRLSTLIELPTPNSTFENQTSATAGKNSFDSTDLSIWSKAEGLPNTSTPYHAGPINLPLPPDTIHLSASRPKRGARRSSIGITSPIKAPVMVPLDVPNVTTSIKNPQTMVDTPAENPPHRGSIVQDDNPPCITSSQALTEVTHPREEVSKSVEAPRRQKGSAKSPPVGATVVPIEKTRNQHRPFVSSQDQDSSSQNTRPNTIFKPPKPQLDRHDSSDKTTKLPPKGDLILNQKPSGEGTRSNSSHLKGLTVIKRNNASRPELVSHPDKTQSNRQVKVNPDPSVPSKNDPVEALLDSDALLRNTADDRRKPPVIHKVKRNVSGASAEAIVQKPPSIVDAIQTIPVTGIHHLPDSSLTAGPSIPTEALTVNRKVSQSDGKSDRPDVNAASESASVMKSVTGARTKVRRLRQGDGTDQAVPKEQRAPDQIADSARIISHSSSTLDHAPGKQLHGDQHRPGSQINSTTHDMPVASTESSEPTHHKRALTLESDRPGHSAEEPLISKSTHLSKKARASSSQLDPSSKGGKSTKSQRDQIASKRKTSSSNMVIKDRLPSNPPNPSHQKTGVHIGRPEISSAPVPTDLQHVNASSHPTDSPKDPLPQTTLTGHVVGIDPKVEPITARPPRDVPADLSGSSTSTNQSKRKRPTQDEGAAQPRLTSDQHRQSERVTLPTSADPTQMVARKKSRDSHNKKKPSEPSTKGLENRITVSPSPTDHVEKGPKESTRSAIEVIDLVSPPAKKSPGPTFTFSLEAPDHDTLSPMLEVLKTQYPVPSESTISTKPAPAPAPLLTLPKEFTFTVRSSTTGGERIKDRRERIMQASLNDPQMPHKTASSSKPSEVHRVPPRNKPNARVREPTSEVPNERAAKRTRVEPTSVPSTRPAPTGASRPKPNPTQRGNVPTSRVRAAIGRLNQMSQVPPSGNIVKPSQSRSGPSGRQLLTGTSRHVPAPTNNHQPVAGPSKPTSTMISHQPITGPSKPLSGSIHSSTSRIIMTGEASSSRSQPDPADPLTIMRSNLMNEIREKNRKKAQTQTNESGLEPRAERSSRAKGKQRAIEIEIDEPTSHTYDVMKTSGNVHRTHFDDNNPRGEVNAGRLQVTDQGRGQGHTKTASVVPPRPASITTSRSTGFQKCLNQWREVEARHASSSSTIKKPNIPEWQDVSLVHHLLPVKDFRQPKKPMPDFGLATQRRVKEREQNKNKYL